MQKMIKVLVKEVGEDIRMESLPGTLEALKQTVGGNIEVIHMASDAALVVHVDSVSNGMKYNMTFMGSLFFGTVVFVGIAGKSFVDVPKSLADMLLHEV